MEDVVLVWIKKRIEEARGRGDFASFTNYEEMYKLWERRINDKNSKDS